MPGDSEDATEWKIISYNNFSPIVPIFTGWRIVSKQTGSSTPLYEGMHRMICKLAWQYARRCMLDTEDLINEGYLALLNAQEKYDPRRASRSTFVYWVVRNHFWKLAKRWPMHDELPEHLSCDPKSMLERSHAFRQMIQSLSVEAKEVVKLVLQCPQEICELAKNGTPIRMQNALRKILRRRGWIVEQIEQTTKEISEALNYNKKGD